jgi:hypothetical protein
VSFVAAMEDVLSVYEQPYDEDYPQVCLDEKLVTLHGDVVEPLPVQPGHPQRVDYEYERVGTANLFVMVERLAGYRHVDVTERRTALDYARQEDVTCGAGRLGTCPTNSDHVQVSIRLNVAMRIALFRPRPSPEQP